MSKKHLTHPDYEVGYRRPPKASQFKKGQSGNPGGKRKGPPSVKDTLALVMGSEIVLTEDGRRRTATKMEAVFLAVVQGALRGNTKSAALLVSLCERHGLGEVEAVQVLPDEDQLILARGLSRRLAEDDQTGDEEKDPRNWGEDGE